MPTTLPFKDQAIRSATYAGSGRETEFRIKGHPGLIFVVQRPGKDGMSPQMLAGLLLPDRRRTPDQAQEAPRQVPRRQSCRSPPARR